VNGQFSMFENLLTPINQFDSMSFKSMSQVDGCFIVHVTHGIPELTFWSMEATIEIKCADALLSKKLIRQMDKAQPWVMDSYKSQESLLLPFILENVFQLTSYDIPFLGPCHVPVWVRGNRGYSAEKTYTIQEHQYLFETRMNLRDEIIELIGQCGDKLLRFAFESSTMMGKVWWTQDGVTTTLNFHRGNPKYKFMKKLEFIRDTCRSDVYFKFAPSN
jgi:hypothetical protein